MSLLGLSTFISSDSVSLVEGLYDVRWVPIRRRLWAMLKDREYSYVPVVLVCGMIRNRTGHGKHFRSLGALPLSSGWFGTCHGRAKKREKELSSLTTGSQSKHNPRAPSHNPRPAIDWTLSRQPFAGILAHASCIPRFSPTLKHIGKLCRTSWRGLRPSFIRSRTSRTYSSDQYVSTGHERTILETVSNP